MSAAYPGTSNALVSKLSPLPTIDFTLPLYFGAPSFEEQLGKMLAMSEPLRFPASYPHTRSAALDDLVAGSAPEATPCVLMVNPRAGGLIESSDLILNLSALRIGARSSGGLAWLSMSLTSRSSARV